MPGYRLSSRALREVSEILSRLHSEASPSIADNMENRLFAAFNDVGRYPALGHKRDDLTQKPVLFHAVRPYVIMFRRNGKQAQILRVVHGSRDIGKLI